MFTRYNKICNNVIYILLRIATNFFYFTTSICQKLNFIQKQKQTHCNSKKKTSPSLSSLKSAKKNKENCFFFIGSERKITSSYNKRSSKSWLLPKKQSELWAKKMSYHFRLSMVILNLKVVKLLRTTKNKKLVSRVNTLDWAHKKHSQNFRLHLLKSTIQLKFLQILCKW